MEKCRYCGMALSYSVLPVHEQWCKDNQVEEEFDRKALNAKLRDAGYEGDLRKLGDDEAQEELEKLLDKK